MLEYRALAVLVELMQKNNSNNNMSRAMLCQMEKMTTEKKLSQSNLQQKETVIEVISLSNMRGQLFKCVVGAPIRFPRVP